MIESVKSWGLLALAALCVALSLSTCEYKRQFEATDFALTKKNEAIKEQNDEAARQLAAATAKFEQSEKDRKAAEEAQRNANGAMEKQLADLRRSTADQPVRVRCTPSPSRPSGDNAVPKATGAQPAGDADVPVSAGVLDPAAAQLFARDADAIEHLQLAFNACMNRKR